MCVLYVETMCANKFGLGWAHDVFNVACYMFMHFSCIRTFISLYYDIELFGAFLFVPLSLSFVSCFMAPKRKSALSQNPLHSEASSSNSTPSHVRFRDDKARKDFSENFSRQGIHSECQVILSDFSDTDLPTVIYSRGWESLYGIPVNCLSVIIQ